MIMELEKYSGKWVELYGNKVIASGSNAQSVYEEARKKYRDPVIFKVPKKEDTFILIFIR